MASKNNNIGTKKGPLRIDGWLVDCADAGWTVIAHVPKIKNNFHRTIFERAIFLYETLAHSHLA